MVNKGITVLENDDLFLAALQKRAIYRSILVQAGRIHKY